MSNNSLFQWIFKLDKPTEKYPVQSGEFIGNTNAVSLQDYNDVIHKAGDKIQHISGNALETVKVIGAKSNYEFINKGMVKENLDEDGKFEGKDFKVTDLGGIPK